MTTPPIGRRRLPLIVIGLLAAAAFVVAGTVSESRRLGVPDVPMATLLGVVAALQIPSAALVGPYAVVVAGAATGLYTAMDFADGPIYLALPLAAFVAAWRVRPRILVPAIAAGGALVLVGMIVRWRTITGVDAWQTWGQGTVALILPFAAAGIGWTIVARREVRAEQSLRVATQEKLRMAQDLHDGVGHGLAVIAMQAGVALHVLDRDPEAARRAMTAVRDVSRESLDALRAELSVLSGERARLSPRRGVDDLPALVDRMRGAGLEIALRGKATGAGLDDDVDATAYLVVQEALTNVVRHADASHVDVDVRRSGAELHITVVDDGVGTSASGAGTGGGMGLAGMRERLDAVGGTLTTGPMDGGGFAVRATVPVGGGA